jgi:hypothetical protein
VITINLTLTLLRIFYQVCVFTATKSHKNLPEIIIAKAKLCHKFLKIDFRLY